MCNDRYDLGKARSFPENARSGLGLISIERTVSDCPECGNTQSDSPENTQSDSGNTLSYSEKHGGGDGGGDGGGNDGRHYAT